MKTKLLPCVIWFIAGALSGEEVKPAALPPPVLLPNTVWAEVKLQDGRVLQRARVNRTDAGTVTFLHAQGIAKVDRRLLPAELAEVFPFDPDAAAAEAEKNARLAREAAVKNTARVAAMKPEGGPEMLPVISTSIRYAPGKDKVVESTTTETKYVPKPEPPPLMETDYVAAVEAAASKRARRYFEDEKRTGSGATLVWGVECDFDAPTQVAGWRNRWEISGTATYKVYDSVGWGSFSSRKKRFRAFVEVPPGGVGRVVTFEER